MSRLSSRLAATAVVTAVIGGALAVTAPSAGATPTSGALSAFSWGGGNFGELDVPAAARTDVTAIAAGWASGYALKTDGSVIGWGLDDQGQTNIPAAAQSGVVAIDAEYTSGLALKSDGSLVSWGQSAAPPSGLTGITQITATLGGGMALMSDHTIRTWGTGYADIPAGLQGHAVSIDGGHAFSVALTDAGSVVAWGQIGFSHMAPVPEAATSGVKKVVANGMGAAAIKADGSVVTWGDDIGPTPAAAMSGVVDVTVDDSWAMALKSDGTLVAWGHGGANIGIPAEAGYHVSALSGGSMFAMTLHQPVPAPAVTTQPQAATVASGHTASFTAAAAGDPTPTVQWQRANPGSDTFTNISGATAATYTTGTLTAADSGSRFRAVFTNSWGTTTTQSATATVTGIAPAVTRNPTAATVSSGNTATLTAAASGDPTPSVQWQRANPGSTQYANIPGASATTYTTAALTTADSGSHYRAVFTNSVSSATTISAAVTVTSLAPAITRQPAAATLASGTAATFTAAATGDPTPTVQWQRANPGSDTFTNIAGATATTYTTGSLTAGADSGARYRAVFTSAAGTATTQSAAVTVTGLAPTVTRQPTAASLTSGTTATFTATATGDPTPTVQWQRADPGSDTFTNIAGATATTYTTGVLTAADSGARYHAVFANSVDSATTTAATVTVAPVAPSVTRQPTSINIPVAQSASFSAAAYGDPTPTVQWQRANAGSSTFTDISGATSGTYTIALPSTSDNGSRFRAVFTNSLGSVTTDPATLTVSVQTPLVLAPNGAVGQPYLFTIPVTGVLDPTVTMVSGTRPPGLTLSANGTLSGTPTAIGNYTFQVTTDGSPSVANVKVAVQQPATLTGTAPDGQTGLQYQFIPTMTGNSSLSLASGALPDGVRIVNSQTVSGVPTKPGVFTFTLQADNGYGTPATLTQTVTIKQAPNIVPPLSGSLPTGTVGTPYAYQLVTTGYPSPTVSIKSGALPDNLSIDATGKITGTPTREGTFSFTVKASNGTTQDATTFTSIRINPPSPAPTLTGAPPAAVRNADYSYAFTLGGSPTPTVAKASGTLPPGLTLTGATLAGKPTQDGTYTFTLTATNSSGTASLEVTMTVGTAPVFGADAPTGTVGAAYTFSYPVTASPTAALTVTGGTPPAGLGLSAGSLSGTPQKAGVYTFTVTATNQFGTATKTQQLAVNPATTGQAKVTNPPASVQPGATESDTTIPVFAEKTNQTLGADLTVGGVTIPAGTKVNSYYVHADAVGDVNTDHPFSGSVAFGTKVLAVASSTADLQATTPAFGVSGTTYSTSTDQGLEYNDTAALSTQDTVAMGFHVYNTADAIRVITLAP